MSGSGKPHSLKACAIPGCIFNAVASLLLFISLFVDWHHTVDIFGMRLMSLFTIQWTNPLVSVLILAYNDKSTGFGNFLAKFKEVVHGRIGLMDAAHIFDLNPLGSGQCMMFAIAGIFNCVLICAVLLSSVAAMGLIIHACRNQKATGMFRWGCIAQFLAVGLNGVSVVFYAAMTAGFHQNLLVVAATGIVGHAFTCWIGCFLSWLSFLVQLGSLVFFVKLFRAEKRNAVAGDLDEEEYGTFVTNATFDGRVIQAPSNDVPGAQVPPYVPNCRPSSPTAEQYWSAVGTTPDEYWSGLAAGGDVWVPAPQDSWSAPLDGHPGGHSGAPDRHYPQQGGYSAGDNYSYNR